MDDCSLTRRGGARRVAVLRTALWAVLALALVPALSGCPGSEVRRHVIDLDAFGAWGGQSEESAPDSLSPAHVPVSDRVASIGGGTALGIEEVTLFVQLQNSEFTSAEVAVYAHPRRLDDREQVIDEGVRLTRLIRVAAQAAIQLDARNYLLFAEGFEAFSSMIVAGDFYLYVLGHEDVYRVSANVPTLSLLVTEE